MTHRPRRSLRNSYATQYTEPERVAVAQPAMRAVLGSGRWRPEQTRPGHLAVHVVEADRASGCASSARTASRSSCAHVATAQSVRCPASDRATSRACSWISRGILRDGSSFWQPLRFEWANVAIELACAIQKRLALMHGAACSKPLSAGAVVDVVGRVISKVAAREGCRHPASICRTPGCVARCPSPRPASSASEPHRKPYPPQAALA